MNLNLANPTLNLPTLGLKLRHFIKMYRRCIHTVLDVHLSHQKVNIYDSKVNYQLNCRKSFYENEIICDYKSNAEKNADANDDFFSNPWCVHEILFRHFLG